MALDLDKFSPEAKAALIDIGRRYGSQDTLDQANQTLAAYAKYKDQLRAYGFQPKDASRLTQARDMLTQAGVQRGGARDHKRANTQALADALRRAQSARLRARVILESMREDLEEYGDPRERKLAATLESTATAGTTAEALAAQLEVLANTLKNPDLQDIANDRDAPTVLPALEQTASALRTTDQASAERRGTPEETQRMDQLDGIIVRLVRRARKAAQAAARDLGDPALAQAFKLDQLYKSRPAGSREDDGDGGDDDSDDADGFEPPAG